MIIGKGMARDDGATPDAAEAPVMINAELISNRSSITRLQAFVGALFPGDAASRKTGVASAHRVRNRADAPCKSPVLVPRAPSDRVHFADIDKLYTRDNGTVIRSGRDGPPLD
ncbi:hypothetical protein [Defluviimonas sp. SAOS-178_SWC]|uniref:hypothetical protein n=1 Tax=Defluviimonas sp. SAOS-178_SWC TaxID=3121287 RepID=UPI0032217D36